MLNSFIVIHRARALWLALASSCIVLAALAPTRSALAIPVPPSTGSTDNQSAAIIAENQRPGTQNWHIFDRASQHQIEGFASAASVSQDGAIDLFVNTIAPSYHIEIYRMGWYGGSGARLVRAIGPLPGIRQPSCPADAHGMVSCRWQHPYRLHVPPDWLSGVYLAKLTVNPYVLSTGHPAPDWQSYLTFVVRDDAGSSALLFQTGVTTYEVANEWGVHRSPAAAAASCAASFDRPYAQGFGSGDVLIWEYPMLRWLEMNGYDISYDTDIDTDASPDVLLRHETIVTAGRDAYWTSAMRSGAQAALDHGVSLAFFGGAGYHQIQLLSSAAGPRRTLACVHGAGTATAIAVRSHVTAAVHHPAGIPLLVRTREAYDSTPARQGIRLVNTHTWPFAGTGLRDGDIVPGITGGEDNYLNLDAAASPDRWIVLGMSPVISPDGRQSTISATLYTAPSGARAFAAGSAQWSWGLDDERLTVDGTIWISHHVASAALARLTANMLNSFTHGRTSIIPAVRAATTSRPAPSGWYQQPAVITVQPSASLPPGATVQCSLDGGVTWRSYTHSFVLRTSGSGFLECRASVGNVAGPIIASQFPTDLAAVGVRVLSPHPWESFSPGDTLALLWSYDQPASGIAWDSALAVLDHMPVNDGQMLAAANLRSGSHMLQIEIRSLAGTRTTVSIPFVVRG